MEDYKKKYEEALKRAKEIHAERRAQPFDVTTRIFPELKESEDEDEKIRKEIMDFIDTKTIDSDKRRTRWFSYLKKHKPISFTSLEDLEVKMSLMQYISELNQDVVHLHPSIETCNEWIAWLEKQGKQKLTNKVEPKFKVGDTIRPKGSLAEYIIESISGGCYHGKGWGLSIDCGEDYELVEKNPAENTRKISDCDKVDMTEYNNGYECGKQRVLKYPEDYGLCKKYVWSEEDEMMLECVLDKIGDLGTGEMCKDWLKSLKERYTWKPSNEQMEVLNWCKPLWNEPKTKAVLESLIEDLKKLRAEKL